MPDQDGYPATASEVEDHLRKPTTGTGEMEKPSSRWSGERTGWGGQMREKAGGKVKKRSSLGRGVVSEPKAQPTS
jgi:hypothetical protein